MVSFPLLNIVKNKHQRLEHLMENITGMFMALKNSKKASLQTCIASLNSLNPLHTLERGFSITRIRPSMKTITDSKSLKTGDRLNITFAKGAADCKVIKAES